ncbi:helix-turn-helix transcriptional regulator [Labrenzia sp. PHM005]|uniref:S24 family peptidase n=1 Tax=Labrenzia sp. PHM005 TaxID=2590016 RepID=UPI001140377A|nr:helix-turn-helix transcriptional regulator [Labrenzia sp. PHM005]QDG78824.1 helix-turn-helix transcriptional regulator [Labrenzia sp. PHM005]
MLSHEKVWAAIDALASHNGLSPSGLARRAGLDPTTFNRSKRVAGDGRPRWPSTESLAKILEATGEGLKSFAARVETPDRVTSPALPKVPFAGLSDVTEQAAFDPTGQPQGTLWETVTFPAADNQSVFALQVSGDNLLPLYRQGDVIIVAPSSAVSRGDRIIIKPSEDHLAVYTLLQRTPERLNVQTIGDKPEKIAFEHSAIEWTARIIWASQ